MVCGHRHNNFKSFGTVVSNPVDAGTSNKNSNNNDDYTELQTSTKRHTHTQGHTITIKTSQRNTNSTCCRFLVVYWSDRHSCSWTKIILKSYRFIYRSICNRCWNHHLEVPHKRNMSCQMTIHLGRQYNCNQLPGSIHLMSYMPTWFSSLSWDKGLLYHLHIDIGHGLV